VEPVGDPSGKWDSGGFAARDDRELGCANLAVNEIAPNGGSARKLTAPISISHFAVRFAVSNGV
jgi:hypothetical protein